MKFRKQFKEITSFDPMTRNFTLASVGLEVFRAKFLKDKSLGITPIAGYSQRYSSMIGNIWLEWCEFKNNITITREYRIEKYFADGFDKQNSVVYEFFGCFYHGCLNCFRDGRENLVKKRFGKASTPNELYTSVQEKLQCYNNLKLKTEVIWECEF